jgi:hypothetical protein
MPSTIGIVASGLSAPLELLPFLWLDAADTTTITASSGSVSQWNDKSGNGRNVSQSNAANQPTTGVATQNGLNVLDFNVDLLQSAAFTQAQPFTAAVVARSTNTGTGNRQAVGNDGTTPTVYENNGVWRIFAGTELISTTARNDAWHYFSAIFNGSSSNLRLDGTQIASGNAGTNGYSNRRINIGSSLSGGNPSATWLGQIAEVILFSRVLSADEIAEVETYLANKWGL